MYVYTYVCMYIYTRIILKITHLKEGVGIDQCYKE